MFSLYTTYLPFFEWQIIKINEKLKSHSHTVWPLCYSISSGHNCWPSNSPGLLSARLLDFHNFRRSICVILLPDLLCVRIVKNKWSECWNLGKIVLRQDVLVFDRVDKQGSVPLQRETKRNKKSNSVQGIADARWRGLNHRHCCSIFAYCFFLPGAGAFLYSVSWF